MVANTLDREDALMVANILDRWDALKERPLNTYMIWKMTTYQDCSSLNGEA